jgi:hypothetical protein
MTEDSAEPNETMRAVDHTHPHTNDTFGTVFTSGQAVAADGGKTDRTDDTQTMADVDHTSTDEGVDRAYERGTEGRDEPV